MNIIFFTGWPAEAERTARPFQLASGPYQAAGAIPGSFEWENDDYEFGHQ